MAEEIEGLLHALPALVAVHGVETAVECGDVGVFQILQRVLELGDVFFAARGRRVAAVHETVDQNGDTGAGRGPAQGDKMMDVAVYAAVGKKAGEMKPAVRLQGFLYDIHEDGIGFQRAVFHGHVDTRHVLVDDTARADIEVSDFGVAHIAFGQADGAARGLKLGVRAGGCESVQIGSAGKARGVARSGRGYAPAVHNQEKCGFHYSAFSAFAAMVRSSSRDEGTLQRASRLYISRVASWKILTTTSLQSTSSHWPLV